MATRFTLEPLQKDSNVSRWLERFEATMDYEDADNDKKKSALLASLGPDAYDLIADAAVPSKPSDKTFTELVKLIKQQLQPTKLPIAARYEFYQLRQGNDDVATFIRKLRAASDECAFDSQLEDRLRDQLVMGLANRDAVKRMLTEKLTALTLGKATEIAKAFEAVQRSQQRMTGDSVPEPSVCVMRKGSTHNSGLQGRSNDAQQRRSNDARQRRSNDAICDCCGKSGHRRADCRFRTQKCHH